MIVTFDRLLSEKPFVDLMRDALGVLEQAYQRPVDIEFAGEVVSVYPTLQVHVALLQCRPLSQSHPRQAPVIPPIPESDILFSVSDRQVPSGVIERVQKAVWVDPRAYLERADADTRLEIARVVGRLNHALAGQGFILMGPGRWGSSNSNLGVKVTYGDIHHTAALVEIAFSEQGGEPEVSYGTHFFQDLVESNIYPLPLYPNDPGAIFDEGFFQQAPNLLADILPDDAAFADYVRVIDIPAASGGRALTILMSSEVDRAVGFLAEIAPPAPG